MSILFVTKPMAPPWHDSSSNLARSLVWGLQELHTQVQLRVMTPREGSGLEGVEDEAIYSDGGSFAPGLGQNLRVFRRLLSNRGERLRHFFFAPNPRSAMAARTARVLRRQPSVHTLCSMPPLGRAVAPSLFADRQVVLSPAAQSRLAAEGVESTLVEPAAVALDASPEGIERCRDRYGDYLLFAGDLRSGGGAIQALETLARLPEPLNLVVASRPKGSEHQQAAQELESKIQALKLEQRVHRVGRIDWIGDLVAGARLQLLPARDLTGKMDYPLVLLEGLAVGVPAVVATESPLAYRAGDASLRAAPAADATALAQACEGLLSQDFSEEATALYRERFKPVQFATGMTTVYREMGLLP